VSRRLTAAVLLRQRREDLRQPAIETRVGAQAMEQPPVRRQQGRQAAPQLGDRERLVDTEPAHGPHDTTARTVPDLAQRIARPDEQHRVMAATDAPSRQHRLRFRKAGQEVQVAARPVVVVHVAVAQRLRRGRHQQQSVAETGEEELPALAMECRVGGGVAAHSTILPPTAPAFTNRLIRRALRRTRRGGSTAAAPRR
jgi:hypothetical protein